MLTGFITYGAEIKFCSRENCVIRWPFLFEDTNKKEIWPSQTKNAHPLLEVTKDMLYTELVASDGALRGQLCSVSSASEQGYNWPGSIVPSASFQKCYYTGL